MTDIDLKPEEFAEAATDVIAAAHSSADFKTSTQTLADAGLCGVCAAEEAGGLALGIEFALPLVAEAGRQRLQWPLLETILVAKALGDSPLAAELASGAKVATWALQGSLAEGFAGHARHASVSDWVLVSSQDGKAALVDISSIQLNLDDALDPDYPQAWMSLDGAKVLAEIDSERFAAFQRDGQILIASLLNGAAEGALSTTASYMSTRVQFGRPLASKQAVRHILARMRLVQEASSAGILRLLRQDEYGTVRAAQPVLANAIASSAFVLEKAIQLHGGMGFTWELPLHYSLREIRKFEAAFGSGELSGQVGREFIQSV